MKVVPIEEFAARRRGEQDDLIEELLPIVVKAIRDNDYEPLLAAVKAEYTAAFRREGGATITRLSALMTKVEKMLTKVPDEPLPSTAHSTAVALAVAILNYATMDAAGDDPEPLVMEWVTMHDDAVRPAHKEAEGQQRPIGESFDVGGEKMVVPGDMSASIENWINCRCSLAPAFMNEEATSQGLVADGGTVSQTQEETMEKPDLNVADFPPMQWHGVLAPEEEWSGDGRMFMKDSLSSRDLPLPLTWQKQSADGHDGSVVIGSIDTFERRGNLIHSSGTFLPTAEADELIGMITHFGQFGVSVDADDVEFEFDEEDSMSPKLKFSKARVSSASVVPIPAFTQAWIALGPEEKALAAGVYPTIKPWEDTFKHFTVTHPTAGSSVYTWGGYPLTFNTTTGYNPTTTTTSTLTFGRGPGWITDPEATRRIHAYWTTPGQPGYEKINWGVPGDFNRCRVEVGEEIGENSPEKLRFINAICAQWHHDALGFWPGRAPSEQSLEKPEGEEAPAIHLTAGVGIIAPAEWFGNPEFSEPTPLTVTPEGRVFGHIAEWGTCHVGFDGVCVEPPPSSFDYAYFMTGAVLTDQGEIAVGHLTAGGGHAGMDLSPRQAAAFYDKTSAVVADVSAGEDEHGVWVAGWTRPGITEEQVYTLRASAISGDWREIGGSLELIAAHCVNSPGFPVVRVAAGSQKVLIAAAGPQKREVSPEDRIADSLAEKVAAALEARQARRERMAALRVEVEGGGE